MKIQRKEKGFTIIEVVLVLAIAGLIFLMVFIALPALQRGQRDTARKNDVSVVSSAVSTYTGNNRGEFPTTSTIQSYVENVSDNTSSVMVGDAGPRDISPDEGVVVVSQSTTCGDSSTTKQELLKGSARQYTVVTKLEDGGGAYYCQVN